MDSLLPEIQAISQDVCFWREVATGHKALAKERKDELLQDEVLKDLAAMAGDAEETLKEAEGNLRLLVVEHYEKDPEHKKDVAPGLKIQVRRLVGYDRSEVLEWCKREASAFLTVDWGAFEDYVTKSKTPPSIVTFEEAPQATIATDLRKALLEAEGLAF